MASSISSVSILSGRPFKLKDFPSLKKCNHESKVRSIAWMSLIANSDGFMDPQEWKLIYYIYNTELKLKLSEIMEMQKQLPRPD